MESVCETIRSPSSPHFPSLKRWDRAPDWKPGTVGACVDSPPPSRLCVCGEMAFPTIVCGFVSSMAKQGVHSSLLSGSEHFLILILINTFHWNRFRGLVKRSSLLYLSVYFTHEHEQVTQTSSPLSLPFIREAVGDCWFSRRDKICQWAYVDFKPPASGYSL